MGERAIKGDIDERGMREGVSSELESSIFVQGDLLIFFMGKLSSFIQYGQHTLNAGTYLLYILLSHVITSGCQNRFD